MEFTGPTMTGSRWVELVSNSDAFRIPHPRKLHNTVVYCNTVLTPSVFGFGQWAQLLDALPLPTK